MHQPHTIEALAELVRSIDGPITPHGAGLHQHLGNPAQANATVIDCTQLNHVHDYIASDLTITVGAGIRLGALQDLLREHNQWLPWDAPQAQQASVAGLLAAGLSGPLRHGFGSPRDWLLGMRFVTGDGRIIKSGGKVVKNVAGYDLHKLHIGALGTLGIIAEVSFKVAPIPQADQSLQITCKSLAEAHALAYALRQRPFNPSAILIDAQAEHVALWVRWLGVTDAVVRQLADARRKAPHAQIAEKGDWQTLSQRPFSTTQGTQLRIGVAPQHLLQVYPVLMAHLPDVHVQVMPTIGLIRAYGQHAPDVTALRRALAPFAGYVVVEIGDDADRWGPAPAGFGMMQALRQSWDPAHKLNPGRYIVG